MTHGPASPRPRIPDAYLIFAYVYSALGGRFAAGTKYPYPFMDIDENGPLGVFAWIAGLSVARVGVGYVFYGLDRWAGHRAAVRADAEAPAPAPARSI